jgi:uncharacterized phage protein (TIGR01671 family)
MDSVVERGGETEMRDIKFRAWTTQQWIYGDLLTKKTDDLLYYIRFTDEQGDTIAWRVDPLTISQSTGLKDKNGEEIYEGDIVKMHYFYQSLGANMGVVESEEEITGEVFHDEFGWAITKIRGRHWEDLTSYESGEGKSYIAHLYNMDGQTHEESFEVIGNIYESPELLK